MPWKSKVSNKEWYLVVRMIYGSRTLEILPRGKTVLVFGLAGNGPPDVKPPISCQAKERAGVDGAGHNSGKVVGLGEGKWVDDGGWFWWDMESLGLRAF